MKRTTRYILFEIFPLFIMGNFFFVLILLLEQMVQMADFVLVRNVGFSVLAQVIVYMLPSMLVITIPISTLLAVLLAFNRLSSDSEIVAMRSCGAGNKVFIIPVLIVGLFSAILGGYFSTVLLSKGSGLAIDKLNNVLENISINNIREKELYNELGDMIFYANKKIDNSQFERIFLINKNDKSIISARKGNLTPTNHGSIMMQFEGGKFTIMEQNSSYTTIQFEKMSMNMPLNLDVEAIPMNERIMGLYELRNNFNSGEIYKFEYSKRFSMPFSAILMALMGLSLGIFLKRSGNSIGIIISCAVALIFNVMFIIGESIVTSGAYNSFLLAWAPNIIFSIFLIPILRRTL